MDKKVMIYTRAYNAESTLRRAVDSILAQDFCGIQPEYFLIDNGSTDGTAAIIADYARRYRWIQPIHLDVNILAASALVEAVFRSHPGDGYYVHLDADDAYHPRFFQESYRFLREERLDIAACGVALVDEAGETRGVRQLPGNAVWNRAGYGEGYLQFRRFFMEPWGKLYCLPMVWESLRAFRTGIRRASWDYQDTLDIVARTERIGVLSRPLYRYYSSPTQSTKEFHPEDIQTLPWQINWLRQWLAQFGPVSRLNEDYLAAIYLGWCGNLEERLLSDCGMTDFEKLAQLQALLSLPETAAVLSRSGCDPQFRNLAARGAFLEHLRATISDLGGDPGCIPNAQYQS